MAQVREGHKCAGWEKRLQNRFVCWNGRKLYSINLVFVRMTTCNTTSHMMLLAAKYFFCNCCVLFVFFCDNYLYCKLRFTYQLDLMTNVIAFAVNFRHINDAVQLQWHAKLLVPPTHNKLGDRSFSAAGPRLWTTFHPDYVGRDWPSTPSDNIWNLIYLAPKALSDCIEFIGALQTSVLSRCWLGGRKGILPVKNWVVGCWCGCLVRDADLHMAQLMPLPLTVSCFSKIQTGFIFLVPAHPGSPGQRTVKRVRVCVYKQTYLSIC